MATALATTGTGTGTAGDVTITKPVGLANGDMMVAFVTSVTAGAAGDSPHATPAGWTVLAHYGDSSNSTVLTVAAKVADAADAAAANFSFTSSDDNDNTIGVIARITGAGFTSPAANIVSSIAHTNDYPTLTGTGVTTANTNSLLLMCGASEIVDGDIDFTAYAVANNNPSWTEQQDINYEPSGVAINLGLASATYAPIQATGNFSLNVSADGGDITGALVSIIENTSVTATPDVLTSTASIQAPTVTAAANVYPGVNESGLIAHYRLDETAASTVVVDSTANQSNATASQNASVMTITGKIGTAFDFNGTTDYINIPHHASQLLTSGFTISAWIKPDSAGEGPSGRIVDKSTGSAGNDGFMFGTRSPSGGTGLFFSVNAGTQLNTTAQITLGAWQHVLVTVTSAAIATIYINGVEITSGTVGALSGITTTNDLRIGNRSGATDRSFDGAIDDVRIYNRVLSPTEIAQIYNLERFYGTLSIQAPTISVSDSKVTNKDKNTASTIVNKNKSS